jgi:hypothetical protein
MASRRYMFSNGQARRIAGGADIADFGLLHIYMAEPAFQTTDDGKKTVKILKILLCGIDSYLAMPYSDNMTIEFLMIVFFVEKIHDLLLPAPRDCSNFPVNMPAKQSLSLVSISYVHNEQYQQNASD